jgi:CIC family chloride channel protein
MPVPLRLKSLIDGSRNNRYALLEAALIGCISAISALILKQGIRLLGGYRLEIAHQFGPWLTLPLMGLILGILAGWLIEQFAPTATGGGIPQVKAALAQFPIVITGRVALIKIIGTILVLGAGLPLGRRGPTVHIGAALAAQWNNWFPTSPEHRRQMIAAGAAAGLAAGFDTPIAGVLFVVEELMRDVSDVTLETAIVASFTGAIMSRLLGSADLKLPSTMSNISIHYFSGAEIPIYFLLGILAGVLGGFFNQGMLWSGKMHRRLNLAMPWRLGLICLISGLVIASLPTFFRDNAGLRDILVTGEAGWKVTAIAFIAHFLLTILAYSGGAPGGLFAPALVLGAALGYLLGMVDDNMLHLTSPNTLALAGMGAFFTAVVRVPITAIVIVFEMISDFNIVLPLMIASAVAYIVAENVSPGSLYQHLLKASGIHLEDLNNNSFLTKLKAQDVMQSQVETLDSNLTLDEVRYLMSNSSHRGFPVVEDGNLIGIVTQGDLEKGTKRPTPAPLKAIMTPKPITINSDASLSDVLYLLNRYQLSRLPVTEDNKLIGIITRTDIIRAEVQQLSGTPNIGNTASNSPSYTVYQTRSPATGKGRILVPVSNPNNATTLLEIAATIAKHNHYELECIQVIQLPKHCIPNQTKVNISKKRKLMAKIERLGRHWKIPVHTQIIMTQNASEAILETVHHRHINIMLMGWKGKNPAHGTAFGTVFDALINQVPCDLILVKISETGYPHHLDSKINTNWLVPIAGGPNAQRALELLPSFTDFYTPDHLPRIWLSQINLKPDLNLLDKSSRYLSQICNLPIISVPINSNSVSETVIHLASKENFDVVMLGASRESLLKQVIHGNIPEAIAREVKGTVIIVRGAL